MIPVCPAMSSISLRYEKKRVRFECVGGNQVVLSRLRLAYRYFPTKRLCSAPTLSFLLLGSPYHRLWNFCEPISTCFLFLLTATFASSATVVEFHSFPDPGCRCQGEPTPSTGSISSKLSESALDTILVEHQSIPFPTFAIQHVHFFTPSHIRSSPFRPVQEEILYQPMLMPDHFILLA